MSVLKQLVFTPSCLICKKLGVEFCLTCVERFHPFRANDLIEIDACFCAGEYSDWLREAVICYKNSDTRYTEILSHLLRKTVERFIGTKDITLIPVPSSAQKIRERGFDTVTSLCQSVTRQNRLIKIDASILYLRRAVVDQVGLTALQRQENLREAFGSRKVISGTVVIVDDVVTTGATLNSAANVLRRAGAQRVFAVTLCGTPKIR